MDGELSDVEVLSDESLGDTMTSVRSRKLQKPWTREEDFVMVKMIEEREPVWNWRLPMYKNQAKKTKCWKEIAKNTNHSVTDAKIHWNTVRSRFNLEQKKVLMSKSREGIATYEPKYELYRRLQFLLKAGPKPRRDKKSIGDCSIIEAEKSDTRDSLSSCSTPNTLKSSPPFFNFDSYEFVAASKSKKQQPVSQSLYRQHLMTEMADISIKDKWKKVFSEFVFYELERYEEHDAQNLKSQIMMVCMNFRPAQNGCVVNESRSIDISIKEESPY